MQPGKIVILNGTSSSGKTSILHALQDQLAEPFLEAGIDKFIWMMPGRFLDRPLWDDVLGQAIKAGQAGHLLINGMHRAILALSQAGCNILADHVLIEAAWVSDCIDLFANRPAWLVGIHCSPEVLEQRERSRKDRTLGQACNQYPLVHREIKYDLQVDTSVLSIEECALLIMTRLESPPCAFLQMQASRLETCIRK